MILTGKADNRIHSGLHILEDGICYGALIFITLLPVADLLSGVIFQSGIPSAQDMTAQFLLVLSLLSAMITTRNKEHLSIGLVHYIKNEKILNILEIITGFLSGFTCVILAVTSVVYIKVALFPARMTGFLPEWVFAAFLPAAFAVMAKRFFTAAASHFKGAYKLISTAPLLLALAALVPMAFKFVWGLDLPDFAWNISAYYSATANLIKIPALIILVLLALAGTPLFIIFAAVSILLFESQGWEIDTVITDISFALTKTDFIAIPLFTLTGFFLSESRAGERLVKTFRAIFGWFPGGMIIVTVLICAFFTTFTGASGVTILALGGILYSILRDNAKYPEHFSVGLIASSGSIGLLFPPSLPIILTGIALQENILKFFAGGILPGLILILAMIAFGIVISVRIKIPVQKFSLIGALRSIKQSVFEILLPVILLAGYIKAGLSLVQISAIALIYIFITEVFITKDIRLRDVLNVFARAVPISGGIIAILALSKALSDYIIFTQTPEYFAAWLQNTVSSRFLFLLLLNVTLLVVGCFMDIFSAIVVVLPLIAPLGAVYGVSPVHLGIIFLINLEAGFLTPPVGLNLFLASYRFKKPFIEICACVLPFLLIQFAVVLLVTYIPEISTALPALIP